MLKTALSIIESIKEFYPAIFYLLKTGNYQELQIVQNAFSLKRERRGSILIYSKDIKSLKSLFTKYPNLYSERRFAAVDSLVVDFFKENMANFSYIEECSLFIPAKYIDLNSNIINNNILKQPPEGSKLRELVIDDAILVNRYWPFANGEETEGYIRDQIKAFGGYLYEYNSKPVCWALRHDDGSLGFLHTLEEYRKLGFAENITKCLMNKVENLGEIPFGYVVKNNIASEALLLKSGFKNLKKVFWISLNDK
ncbi:hypothetical protein JXR93_10695 [bacterium]|nr:hypothetical protein [bacterium]